MILHDKRILVLAVGLSALAGYIDAFGFISLGGFFVSFMSGNTTRLGIALSRGTWTQVGEGAGIIVTFVCGACLGALVNHFSPRRPRPKVLAMVTLLLAVSAFAYDEGSRYLCIACMILAMGTINATFLKDGEVSVGLTYMTGALVKVGHRFATALTGGETFGWVPHLLLWTGLIGGTITGGLIHGWLGLDGLWGAVVYAGMAAVSADRIDAREVTSR